MALAADDEGGAAQRILRAVRKAGATVLADADKREPPRAHACWRLRRGV